MNEKDQSHVSPPFRSGGAGQAGRSASATRTEQDSMGEVSLPATAYWGAQTQRARENFRVSGRSIHPALIAALGRIKAHAARVNCDLGLLDVTLAPAIEQAAREVADGELNDQFPVDVFQTGSGTSSNMNANEVIANRANELLGARRGTRHPVHPNDHVNCGQSSNDAFPTAIHLAVRQRLVALERALERVAHTLRDKSRAFSEIIKIGRTHLQDAVPMTLGQEFGGYATQIEQAAERIAATHGGLEELALGGTAVGTGLSTHPEFAARVVARLGEETSLPFRPSSDAFAALGGRDALVATMGALNGLAVVLMKIANDLRLLASGPRAGLGEIRLPALQPGSSIMPGKVNPVIPEMVIQVAAHVMGQNLAVTIGGQHGPLELNMMMPMMAENLLAAIDLLERALSLLDEKCLQGLVADRERCAAGVEQSLALVTPLARRLGYDRAAEISQRAWREGKTIRQVALEMEILPAAELEKLLDPWSMI